MKIVVASGKGGTGKTSVATSLATVASATRSVTYLDCDVEEPNGAILLNPVLSETWPVKVPVPRVNSSLCSGCNKCGQICEFGAILPLNHKVLVFPTLCHGCGGCWLVCPNGAIRESGREVGLVRRGAAGPIRFVDGALNIGEATSPPVIREVLDAAAEGEFTVIDSPPGTACPVIETMRAADYVILVAEPTPFGLHDLRMAVDLLRVLDRPFGVVINRAGQHDAPTRRFCEDEAIEVLGTIPEDRRVAEAYSRGVMMCDCCSEYRTRFEFLVGRLDDAISPRTAMAGATAP